MRGIITVLGHDKVGIIARICTYLASRNVNVLDINQTLLQDIFTMVMLVDLNGSTIPFNVLSDELAAEGESMGLSVRIQNEQIFNAMHKI